MLHSFLGFRSLVNVGNVFIECAFFLSALTSAAWYYIFFSYRVLHGFPVSICLMSCDLLQAFLFFCFVSFSFCF